MQLSPSNQGFPLPAVVNPSKTICVQIEIPDEPAHITAFLGVMFDLTQWINWQRDAAHTGTLAAQVWKPIWQKLSLLDPNSCVLVPQVGSAGVEVDLMIRQNPTNPCIFESSLDGVTWCQWADLSKCFQNLVQLGGGSPQPSPGGGTQKYCQGLQASGTILLPTVVNSGDILTLTSASGAGWDGNVGTPWHCYDGQTFFAGACIGGAAPRAGDPLTTAPHMSLIYNIGGTYYSAVGGPITVPSGVTNQQVTVQINAGTLNICQGSYDVCVTVTNNKVGSWSHTLDLTTNPYTSKFTLPNLGLWTPGQGYVFTTGLAGSEYYTGLTLQATWTPATTITRVAYNFDITVGTISDPANGAIEVQLNSTLQPGYVPLSALVTGAGQNFNWSGSQTGITTLLAFLASAEGHSSPPSGGSGALKTITIGGSGFDPFA